MRTSDLISRMYDHYTCMYVTDHPTRKDKSVVTIIASKEKFVIHKEFISHYSKYFDHAFKREFIEGKTREMDFPHVNPSIFGMISHWLYTQQ